MTYSAKIICDSISSTGKRLTTFEITFPRIVLAAAKTHRVIRGMGGNIEEELWLDGLGINDDENLSRNSASSRAIPFKKQIERVLNNPFIPERFPIDGKGMQPGSYIYGNSLVYAEAKKQWLNARDKAVESTEILYNCLKDYEDNEHKETHIHKQIVNRLLEPFMWHTAIVTATEWDNFFKLRTNEQAQYEVRRVADLMYEAYHAWDNTESEILLDLRSPDNYKNWIAIKPKELNQGEWHLPFISDEDEEQIINYIESSKNKELYDNWYGGNTIDQRDSITSCKKEISVARCARVSYLTHDGKRDIEKDLELFERLRTSNHWSPFEHVATPSYVKYVENHHESISPNREEGGVVGWNENLTWIDYRSGNFIGWKQYRKEFQDENCTHFRKGE